MSAGELLDDLSEDDSPKEACGVFGVYAPGQPVAHLTYLGLFALQHRGQESAGHGRERRRRRSPSSRTRAWWPPSSTTARWQALVGHLAIGHCRYSTTGIVHLAQRPARLPGRRRRGTSRSATTATSPTPRRWPRRPGCCPAPSPATPTWSPSCSAAELGHLPEDRSDERDLELALASVLPRLEGAFSLVVMDESRVHRRPRPQRVPPALPRQARARLGAGLREPSARHRGRPLRARARAGRDGGHRRHRAPLAAAVPGRARRPEALPLRVRLLRPAGHPALQPERPPGPHPHRRAAGRPGSGRGRHGDGRAGVGRARGRGLRPPQRHPLRSGRREEPLHRSQLHRPEPGAAGSGRADEAEPAARERRRQAHRRGRRLDRAGHHPAAAHEDAPRGGRHRGAPPHHVAAGQVVLLLRHRHRRPHGAARRVAHRRRDPRLPQRRHASPTSSSTACRRHRRARRRVLRRLLHRQLPGRGARHAAQARPRGRPAAAGRRHPSRPRSTEGHRLVGHQLRGRRGQHRRRRGGGRAHQVEGPLDLPTGGHRRHRWLRWAVRVRAATATRTRSSCRPPTASAPRR